jgi:hypothetical protein
MYVKIKNMKQQGKTSIDECWNVILRDEGYLIYNLRLLFSRAWNKVVEIGWTHSTHT